MFSCIREFWQHFAVKQTNASALARTKSTIGRTHPCATPQPCWCGQISLSSRRAAIQINSLPSSICAQIRLQDPQTPLALRMLFGALRCMGGMPQGCGLHKLSDVGTQYQEANIPQLNPFKAVDILHKWFPAERAERGKRTVIITAGELRKVSNAQMRGRNEGFSPEEEVRRQLSALLDDSEYKEVFLIVSALSKNWREENLVQTYSGRNALFVKLGPLSQEQTLAVLNDQLKDQLDNFVVGNCSVSEDNLVLCAAATGGWPRVLAVVVAWLKKHHTFLKRKTFGYADLRPHLQSMINSMEAGRLPSAPLFATVETVLSLNGKRLDEANALASKNNYQRCKHCWSRAL